MRFSIQAMLLVKTAVDYRLLKYKIKFIFSLLSLEHPLTLFSDPENLLTSEVGKYLLGNIPIGSFLRHFL